MIDELHTEAGSDILILGNGTDPDDYSTTLDEFSGRADGEGAFSISRETWLRFSTDGSVTYEGFSLQIYAVENGEKKNQTELWIILTGMENNSLFGNVGKVG